MAPTLRELAAEPVRPAELQTEIDRLARPLIDGQWLYGIAIGAINTRGQAVFGYGRMSQENGAPPDDETVFELGSISKVFTGLALADMVERGEVRLDTPVQALLPASVRLPTSAGQAMTLRDLATHTAGLPRLPTNLQPHDPQNPYAEYTTEKLFAYLPTAKLSRAPQQMSEYSNLGIGLLGAILARHDSISYEQLIANRILQPLDMLSTAVELDDALRHRMAEPHDADGAPVKPWDIPGLAGAGGLRSTVGDMLRFLVAELQLHETPLAAAVRLSQQPHFTKREGRAAMGLAWQINVRDNIVWHNGQTGGYHTFIALRPDQRAGVVVLTNTGTSRAVDDLGLQVLNLLVGGTAAPLDLPRIIPFEESARREIVGVYQSGVITAMVVEQQDDDLIVKLPGQAPRKLLPTARDKLICRDGLVTIELARDDDGHVQGATIDIFGERVETTKKSSAK